MCYICLWHDLCYNPPINILRDHQSKEIIYHHEKNEEYSENVLERLLNKMMTRNYPKLIKEKQMPRCTKPSKSKGG